MPGFLLFAVRMGYSLTVNQKVLSKCRLTIKPDFLAFTPLCVISVVHFFIPFTAFILFS